jgi:N-methylhydantoinase B
MSPGSMPFAATELVQEGLVIPPVRLEARGVLQEDVLAMVLANVRTPEERLGDLRAQRAACAAGCTAWRQLVQQRGVDWCGEAVHALLSYTERVVRTRLRALEGVSARCEDQLDGDGVTESPIPVCAAVSITQETLHIDLAGSSPPVAGNVNAPIAVARAAGLFALRVLMHSDDVPVNEGLSRALVLHVPDACIANAKRPHAVAAGNVELSQRLTDVILSALTEALRAQGHGTNGLPAQGQGTMNNITIGARGWTFYETLGGGQGASAHADGPSAVHVGMSNTRNTPVESLEWAYPMRIPQYALRHHSGGNGAHRGGDGVIRSYELLEPAVITLLTERRLAAPRGAAGGDDGVRGENRLQRAGAVRSESLPPKGRWSLAAGDVVTLATPGGGGYGSPN